ncbi:hypothetical protein CR513_41734, partial [Mucuna pruriens]
SPSLWRLSALNRDQAELYLPRSSRLCLCRERLGQCRGEIYKQKVKFHDQKIQRKDFHVGQKVLVFNSRLKLIAGKLRSKWDGPFVITKIFPNGAVRLQDEHSNCTFQVNGHQIKPFHEGPAPITDDAKRKKGKENEKGSEKSKIERENKKESEKNEKVKEPTKKEKKKEPLLVSHREVKRVLSAKREPLIAMPTTILLNVSPSLMSLPASFEELHEEFKDVFLKDVPCGLPSLRGIEHHMDLTLGATFPNRATYRTNPKESKEIQTQVGKLIEKGCIRESMSPCAMLVILVPKKDGTWRMCTNFRPINNIIIRHKHLIPYLDDFLDELNGSKEWIISNKNEVMNGQRLSRPSVVYTNSLLCHLA